MGRGTHRVDTTTRLADLRELMLKHNVQAYVVPSQDQRAFSPDIFGSLFEFTLDASEYIAGCDQRRAFISGFNGSAGEPMYISVLYRRFDSA